MSIVFCIKSNFLSCFQFYINTPPAVGVYTNSKHHILFFKRTLRLIRVSRRGLWCI